MLALLYAAPGALVPFFTLHLRELDCSPSFIGWACAMQAVGGFLAPILAGQFADRYFAAQRVMAGFAILAGASLWLLAAVRDPWWALLATLLFWITSVPAVSLSSALSFAHLPDPTRQFGSVRLWGTIGWVVPSWLFGWWSTFPGAELADVFRIGALCAWLAAAYTLTMPHTPPKPHATVGFAPLAAVRYLGTRARLVYAFCLFGVCFTLPFHAQLTPLQLHDLGVPRSWLGPALSIAQWSEVTALIVLPIALVRCGTAWTMRVGVLVWVLVLALLAVGRPTNLILGTLLLNGVCIAGFLVAGQMFLNRTAPPDLRASVQACQTFITSMGLLAGNLCVGWLREASTGYTLTFVVGAACAAGVALVFWTQFPTSETLPLPARRPPHLTPRFKTACPQV